MSENDPILLSYYINKIEDSELYKIPEVRILVDNIMNIQRVATIFCGYGTDKSLLVEVLRNIAEWEVE